MVPPRQGTAVRLDDGAAFTRLPRPDHDADGAGLRPGSQRVPATVGAVLLLAAPFGAWTRVVEATVAGADPVVDERLGLAQDAGWLLVVAAVAAVLAVVLLARPGRWQAAGLGAGGLAVVLPVAVLLGAQADLDATVQAAIARADVASRGVTLGWGGWAAMVGAAAMAVAILVAVLLRLEHSRPAPSSPDPPQGWLP